MKKLFFLLVGVFVFTLSYAQTEDGVIVEGVVPTQTEAPVSNVSELAPKANELADKYNSLVEQKLRYETFLQVSKDNIQVSKEKLDILKKAFEDLTNSKYTGYDKVVEIGTQVKSLSDQTEKTIALYTEKITELSNIKKEWETSREKWQQWRTDFYKDFNVVRDVFVEANKNINLALSDIAKIEKPLLGLQTEYVSFQSDVKNLLREINTVSSGYKKDVFTKTNVTFFSKDFWSEFNLMLFSELSDSLSSLKVSFEDISSSEGTVLLLHILCVVTLLIILFKIKGKNSERENLRKLSSRGVATSLFVSTVIMSPHYGVDISVCFKIILLLIASISGARIISGFISAKSTKIFIDILVIAFVVSRLFVIINIPEPIIRIYIVLMTLFIFIVLAHRNKKNEVKFWGKNFVVICMKILLVITFFAQIAGYSQFSIQIFDASIRSIFSGILAWLLGALIKEFFYVVFTYSVFSRINFCKNFSEYILKRLNFITDIVIYFFTICIVLVAWGAFGDINQAMTFLSGIGVATESVKLTLGSVALAIFLFYLVISISWIVQRALEDQVYPRKKVQIGVQTSINRIIQYVFVCIGVIISLSVLGVELKSLAVVFGVLGVGIGFGLQNIVNNFASGLILLFERPIKVGDVIDVNGQKGEVKKLGLRATVVETYDKSEVIVPNSDIASSQVVNWTLSNRKIRTLFSVGVSYNSDVEKVKKLLLDIANDQEGVLKNPEPSVTFMAFGDSSLDFELRVWSKIDDGLVVKDDINTKIYNVFKKENIEIPFPQRDVNLVGLEDILKKIISKKD